MYKTKKELKQKKKSKLGISSCVVG